MSESQVESEIRDGALARLGALGENEVKHAAQLVKQVESDGIETIRIYSAFSHSVFNSTRGLSGFEQSAQHGSTIVVSPPDAIRRQLIDTPA